MGSNYLTEQQRRQFWKNVGFTFDERGRPSPAKNFTPEELETYRMEMANDGLMEPLTDADHRQIPRVGTSDEYETVAEKLLAQRADFERQKGRSFNRF